MTCPNCGGKTTVCGSRPSEDSIDRKRKCLECGYVFATIEIDADLWKSIQKSRFGEEEGDIDARQFNHRLTEEDVRYILENYKSGDHECGAAALGRKFDVDRKTILAVVNGKRKKWRNLM